MIQIGASRFGWREEKKEIEKQNRGRKVKELYPEGVSSSFSTSYIHHNGVCVSISAT